MTDPTRRQVLGLGQHDVIAAQDRAAAHGHVGAARERLARQAVGRARGRSRARSRGGPASAAGGVEGAAGISVLAMTGALSQGTFKAFSSTCTHQGCTVGEVLGGSIKCPCHGSQFSAENGSVQQGPATRPLPQYQVRQNGGQLTLG